jgi:hypothetical protein
MDDEITLKIEGARDMLDNWIHFTMFSTKASRAMNSTLTESDFFDLNNADSFDYHPDQDGFFEPPASDNEVTAESAAARPPPTLRDVYEKRVTTTEVDANSNQRTKRRSSKSTTPPSNKGKNGAFRTCSTRRSARMSPVSSSRGSSGGASLLDVIYIDDDDDVGIPSMASLLDDNATFQDRPNARVLANTRQGLGVDATPRSRRLGRARIRTAYEIEMDKLFPKHHWKRLTRLLAMTLKSQQVCKLQWNRLKNLDQLTVGNKGGLIPVGALDRTQGGQDDKHRKDGRKIIHGQEREA